MRKESKKKYNEIIDYLYDKELETTSHYGERERAAAAESLKNVIHLTMILPVAVLVTIAVLSAVLSAAMPSRAILIIIILLVVLTIGGLAFYVMKTLLGSINTSNLSRRNLIC